MKILGLEIKRATQHAVSAQKPSKPATQNTQPSRPLKSSQPRAELGDSGTRMLSGIITEEYNPQLQGVQGIKVYDEMRKSDGTVRAACLATSLPIRRAEWFINPVADADQAQDTINKEIANFVEHALFDWIEDMTWHDILRQALLMIPFGVMPFEKVYGVKDHDGKQYVTLKKLAPRLPKSILQWELPDRTFGIQQIRQDGGIALIPGSKLLIFVNEREGDNWWGTSMLRAAYKHWYYKNNFYKIDAIAFERQGIGVPMIKMPMGYTESDEKKAEQAMQNLRANENAFLILPPGYESEFMNMGSTTTRDPQTSINHHNKEILQSVLAQFLELGVAKSNSGGSHALSQDHSDLFLKAMESIANTIISEINKNLIPELVDLNFQDVKVYPVLDYSGISKVDVESLGNAYSQLVTAGAITPTDDDQQYIRAAMGLPPRTQQDIDVADDEPTMEDMEDHVDIEEEPTDPEEVDEAAKNMDPKAQTADKKKKTDKGIKDKTATDKKTKVAHEHIYKRKYDDGKGFMSWRPLTFAEQKTSWSNIQDAMDKMESDFEYQANALLNDAKDALMGKLHDALDSGDQKAVAQIEADFVDEYKTLLKDFMKKAYEYGKNNVSTEIGVNVPPNNADSLQTIDLLADTIANKTASEIEAQAKLSATNALKQDQNALQAAGKIDQSLEDQISQSVDDTGGIIISQGINNGRYDVFERNADNIYALQRSEILDEKTCDFCLSMDGLVVQMDDKWASTDTFHDNCRGIWVAILNDEQNPPDITGVPDQIGQYYGGSPNELIQPKRPIVSPNSPAAEEAQRRKNEKK